MELNPLVSIITTCYNDGEYLQECIDSVKNQLYSNIEHIIINDGSTDKFTLDLLEVLKYDNSVKLITTENQGVCKARNQAIMESSGQYLLVLDSDDLISSKFVELAVKKMLLHNNVKIVATNYNFFGRVNRSVKLEDYTLEKLMGHNLFVVSTMFRRSDFDHVNGFNPNMKEGLEDWDFWLSILKYGGDVRYIEGVNFFYRIKPKLKSRNITSAIKNHQILRKKLWNNHKELYSLNYPNPLEMQEYLSVVNSREYRLGKIILFPLRKFSDLFHS
jgi:glycosyltransferase involved in cell wall biosynthesis